MLREDTFPSNLALFTRNNYAMDADGTARLTIRKEQTPVREFTSAALCSRHRYLYGRFVGEVRPVSTPGVITGMFLHRNSPRQEIDIEFIGKDTCKMLVNVFYNPGIEGSRMEYGYRGTPTLVDLGFDASEDFHEYEIDWSETSIRWRVDGRLVYELAPALRFLPHAVFTRRHKLRAFALVSNTHPQACRCSRRPTSANAGLLARHSRASARHNAPVNAPFKRSPADLSG